ncbi:hypothetical protein SPRA44_260085 [Serratia proteamaculans]|nr:hypothetical protein SPRA44_260085 [Serratia proteamaculans]
MQAHKAKPPVNRQIRGLFVNLRMGDENLCSGEIGKELAGFAVKRKPASTALRLFTLFTRLVLFVLRQFVTHRLDRLASQ